MKRLFIGGDVGKAFIDSIRYGSEYYRRVVAVAIDILYLIPWLVKWLVAAGC